MSDRRYTVREVDELRELCRNIYVWGAPYPPDGGGMSRSIKEQDMVVAVEEMIRTYMAAGLTAEDIRKAKREP